MFSVTSLGFLPFMALFACLWYRVPQPSRWKLVLAANAVFCLSIDIGAFFAVALATAVVWQAAQHAQPEQPSRRGWLALGLAAALLPLLVLKYSGMLVPGLRDLYKPFGLAYYSLQLAGYLLDVWHGRTAPTPSYARLWCYAGFFLSLTQGPFNRYNILMPQLEAAPKTFETQRLVSGLQRSAWGYFKKFAIADRAAIVVSAAFADPASFDRSQLIFATVMYSFQLYADFSGYTDIVLGMGEILGLHLPENFRQPFFSASVKELWARWHISLSQWFRDYVYIPLGGSRCSKGKMIRNLLVVWLLTGLWHGAGWNFLLWGFLLFVLVAVEKLCLLKVFRRVPILGHVYMILAIPLSWLIFAISDPGQIWIYVQRLFPFLAAAGRFSWFAGDYLKYGKMYLITLLAGMILITPLPRKLYERYKGSMWSALVLILIFWFSVYCIWIGQDDPFMYFAF